MMSDNFDKSIEHRLPALLEFQESLYKKPDVINYNLIGKEIKVIEITLDKLNGILKKLIQNQYHLKWGVREND